MKIAVTSQNRRTVTEHAGRCRKFWVYTIEALQITDKKLLELPLEQSFHESDPQAPHPLDGVTALISASMGQGMIRRLDAKGIAAIITEHTSPDAAVTALLEGRLPRTSGERSCNHHH